MSPTPASTELTREELEARSKANPVLLAFYDAHGILGRFIGRMFDAHGLLMAYNGLIAKYIVAPKAFFIEDRKIEPHKTKLYFPIMENADDIFEFACPQAGVPYSALRDEAHIFECVYNSKWFTESVFRTWKREERLPTNVSKQLDAFLRYIDAQKGANPSQEARGAIPTHNAKGEAFAFAGTSKLAEFAIRQRTRMWVEIARIRDGQDRVYYALSSDSELIESDEALAQFDKDCEAMVAIYERAIEAVGDRYDRRTTALDRNLFLRGGFATRDTLAYHIDLFAMEVCRAGIVSDEFDAWIDARTPKEITARIEQYIRDNRTA